MHEGDGTSATGCYIAKNTKCTRVLTPGNEGSSGIKEGWDVWFVCPQHGARYAQSYDVWLNSGAFYTMVCGANMGTQYVLNCGKTTDTIESATIIY